MRFKSDISADFSVRKYKGLGYFITKTRRIHDVAWETREEAERHLKHVIVPYSKYELLNYFQDAVRVSNLKDIKGIFAIRKYRREGYFVVKTRKLHKLPWETRKEAMEHFDKICQAYAKYRVLTWREPFAIQNTEIEKNAEMA